MDDLNIDKVFEIKPVSEDQSKREFLKKKKSKVKKETLKEESKEEKENKIKEGHVDLFA
ncbi:hypothetical protein [Sulfurihydrogenibium azorense]|jgi:hypothetical protein|uniref:Uncharacterized protein n=1 Tax=Sulfurihydrogenibium azorense (strain DSM 15241 / OCM 825 / Az-Fu1) TaxID=204536 RepID=C1DTQ1_SULAA|nr:hypothetical protein [Sulfurihydrogenibium azorense]ACN99005.1 hypothetical protein SULAZ_0496 [Sulfurihydrogenibium azorense Az-Fu1]MDM7273096.1 hypothetical protein [Sulfurihydrogenibium azorense]